jgi:hypothetical protein
MLIVILAIALCALAVVYRNRLRLGRGLALWLSVAVLLASFGAAHAALNFVTGAWSNAVAGQTFQLIDAGGNTGTPEFATTALSGTPTGYYFAQASGLEPGVDPVVCPTGPFAWNCQVTNPIDTVSSGTIIPLCSMDDKNFAPMQVVGTSSLIVPDAGWINAANATSSVSAMEIAVPAGQPCNYCSVSFQVYYTDGGTIACQMAPLRAN